MNKAAILHQMPQLDGLRALAALSVLWFHWSPVGTHFLGNGLGEIGVWLFFVLSGFLITGILFDARGQVGEGQNTWFMLRQFYARRVLRIFPQSPLNKLKRYFPYAAHAHRSPATSDSPHAAPFHHTLS